MNILLLKRFFLVNLLICCSLSFAQKKIDLKYYVNNTQFPIEDIRIFLATKSDTITPKLDKGKIYVPKELKDNFSMLAQINGKTIKIGSFRPDMLKNVDAIIVGRITDFSTLKRNWENDSSFYIDKEYLIMIPNSQDILDVVYGMIEKDINLSLNSNFASYFPTFTGSYEVIKTKAKE
jgi:hypothetical protein